MDYELSLKNKRVRVWLGLMIPAFILAFILFGALPGYLPGIVPALPLVIGFLGYRLWILTDKKRKARTDFTN